MKLSIFLIFILFCHSVLAQTSEIEIDELKAIRNEALVSVKNFKLEPISADLQSPDYNHARKILIDILDKKPAKLDAELKVINSKLQSDYSVLLGLKQMEQSKATKKTIQTAEERFESKVKAEASNYRKAIDSFLHDGFLKASNYCRTVLCMNRVKVDFENWLKQAKKVNRDVKLEIAKMEKLDDLKDRKAKIIEEMDWVARKYRLAFNVNDKECKNLQQDISLDDLQKFSYDLIYKMGLEEVRKPLIQREKNYLDYGTDKEVLEMLTIKKKYHTCTVFSQVNGTVVVKTSSDKNITITPPYNKHKLSNDCFK